MYEVVHIVRLLTRYCAGLWLWRKVKEGEEKRRRRKTRVKVMEVRKERGEICIRVREEVS